MESRNEYGRPDKKPFEEVKSEEERVYKFKVSLHNGTTICVTFRDPNADPSLEELIHGLKLEHLRSRSLIAESSQNPKQDHESGSIIAETFKDESGAIAEAFKNMWDWDVTPATEILTELLAHYAFQTALATDLMIEESDCHYLLVHPKAKTMLLVVIAHSGTNEYKGECNYSNLMPVGRSENREFELFRLKASVASMLMQPKVLRHRPSRHPPSNSNEPFLFSHRSRTRTYELYYRGRERGRSTISVDLPRSLRRSYIVAHDSHTGWILFMRRHTLMFYSVVEHNLVQVPEDAPISFNLSIKGCFSGDPAGESYSILLVLESTILDQIQITFLRFSRATSIWSFEGRPTHPQYDPISHIQVVGNFVWVDAGGHELHVIYRWADINPLGQLNHIVTPLPEGYPAMPVSALIHGRRAILIGSVQATNALDVRRLHFVNDGGLVEFIAWEDFRGQNIYAVNSATGFGIRPQSNGRNEDDMEGNILFLAGNPPTAHCTRISNLQDVNRVDEHQCSTNIVDEDGLPACDCLHLWFQVEP